MHNLEDQAVYDLFGQLIAEHITVFDVWTGSQGIKHGYLDLADKEESAVWSTRPGIWRPDFGPVERKSHEQ